MISGAYQGEIFRGAFGAIARGELEAARSVGMPRLLLFRRIIAPQALRFAIPGLGNVWQLALKESALIEDMESGQTMEVSPIYMSSRYRERISEHIDALHKSAMRAGADHRLVNITEPLDSVLRSYLLFRQRRG